MPLLDVDDPAFISDPYPALGELRESAPLHWDDDWHLWLVTRHSDVKAAQLDRRLGRVNGGHAEPDDFRPIRELRPEGWEDYYATERHSLLMLEPPEHTRLRGLVSRAFTPRRVRELRQPITEIADGILESLGTDFDLLADYAQPFSIRVIAALLGAPTDDAATLLEWSHAIVKMYELNTTMAQATAAIEASRAFTEWSLDLLARRRAAPEDDLITALAHAETEDGVLTDAEIVSTIILLLNAGHEATVNTMGNGLVALLDEAAASSWTRLTSGDVSPAVAIEEMMRFDSPLQMFERWVLTDDVAIGGQPVAKGDKVALLLGAANRDPREYDEPDHFMVERNEPGHVTFGAGVHYCLGAPLARLELEVALDRLVAAIPTLRLAATPNRTGAFVIRGYESLAVSR